MGLLVSGDVLRRKAVFAARVGWIILPVILGGMIHILALKSQLMRRLAVPLDRGKQWRGRPILGSNKTWRGVLLMTASTAGFTHLQFALGRHKPGPVLGVLRDIRVSPWLAGGVMGLSYCLAELPNSFLKRQLGVPPGGRSVRAGFFQYLVDQVDSVIGCLVALRLLYRPRRGETFFAFFLGSSIHVGVDQLLYAAGVKQSPERRCDSEDAGLGL